jgi:hypothetical protein
VACALLLTLNRYIRLAAIVAIPILLAGIIMIHATEGVVRGLGHDIFRPDQQSQPANEFHFHPALAFS